MTQHFKTEVEAQAFAATRIGAWVSWDRNLMCWVVTYA